MMIGGRGCGCGCDHDAAARTGCRFGSAAFSCSGPTFERALFFFTNSLKLLFGFIYLQVNKS
jgi:hypothetical protein